jgi:hypothetical protein
MLLWPWLQIAESAGCRDEKRTFVVMYSAAPDESQKTTLLDFLY